MSRSILLVLLAACDPNPDLCAVGEPGIVIGTGDQDFVDTPPGATIDTVRGSQGGFHVWTGLAFTGMTLPDSGEVAAHVIATADGETVAEAMPYVDPVCNRDTLRLEAAGVQLRFFSYDPADVAGLELDVTATAVLDDGTTFTGTTTWLVAP